MKEKLINKIETQQRYYNRGSVALDTLTPGQTVRFKPPRSSCWNKARVEEQVDVRSYQIQTENGRRYRRNRKHLRKSHEQILIQQPQSPKYHQNTTDQTNQTGQKQVTESMTTKQHNTENGTQDHEIQAEQTTSISPQVATRSGRLVKKPQYCKNMRHSKTKTKLN